MSGSFPGGSSSLLDRGHDYLSLIIVCEKWRRLIGKAIGVKGKGLLVSALFHWEKVVWCIYKTLIDKRDVSLP